jgi:predicted O-methyltransferase YrrM
MSFSLADLTGPDPRAQTMKEVEALKSLAKELRPNPVIINIGAAGGISTIAFLEERPDAVVFSIDIDPREGERENAQKCGVDVTRIVRLLGKSQDVGRNWPYYVDMVFVDGDHREDGIIGDIEVWLPRVMPNGGILAFHDYFEGEPPPHNPSAAGKVVRRLVEPRDDFEEILFIDRLKAFQRLKFDGLG